MTKEAEAIEVRPVAPKRKQKISVGLWVAERIYSDGTRTRKNPLRTFELLRIWLAAGLIMVGMFVEFQNPV